MQVLIKLTARSALLNCFCQCTIFPLLHYSAPRAVGCPYRLRLQSYGAIFEYANIFVVLTLL